MEDRRTTTNFAENAVKLAARMEGVPPVLLMRDASGERETLSHCPLSGTAARVAILSMTFCNPLVLNAAAVIEGSIR
jgi:hypothetical protein